MKKLFILAGLLAFMSTFAFAQIAKGNSAWVSAKTVTVKSSTGFFASKRGTLAYGDQVSVLQVSGKWAEIRSANGAVSGWLATTSLAARRIVAAGSGSGASANEVALAGKGFNQEVENAYKAGGSLNYADVDKTEAITVADDVLLKFITDGHLTAGDQQ
jgi:SH3-like domain-containing protein